MIRFPCPSCDTSLKTADEKAGTHILCPACGDRVPVPAAGRSGAASKKPAFRDARGDEDDEESASRPSKVGLYIGLGAAACVLFAGAGIAVGLNWFGENKAAETKKAPDRVADASSSSTPSLQPTLPGAGTTPNALPEATKPTEKPPTPPSGTETATPALPKVGTPALPKAETPPKPAETTSPPAVATSAPPSPPAVAADLGTSTVFDPDKVYNRLLKSTVLVMLHQNNRPVGNGSGALIDKENRLILTNHHVVKEVLDKKSKASVFFPQYDEKDGRLINEQKYYLDSILRNQGAAAWVVHHDAKRDLALLQVTALQDGVQPLPLASKSPGAGQPVLSVGNPEAPKLGVFWVSTRGNVRTPAFRKHWVAGNSPFDRTEHDCTVLLTDSPTNHGDSGGPLVNARKELVAVVQGAATDASNLSIFVDVSEVRAFLNEYYKKNNMKPLPEKPATELVDASNPNDLQGLIKGLTGGTAATRAQAASLLGQIGPEAKRAVGPLVNALKDADPDVRKNAAEALAQIGSLTQSQLPALLEATKDAEKDVQVAALGAIKTMGGNAEQAIPALREVLKTSKEEAVRKMAANTLANMGTAAKAAVPEFAAALKDPSPSVRSEAALALGKMGADAAPALKELGAAVKDSQVDVQVNVLKAIEAIGPDAAPLLPDLERALEIKNKEVRRYALTALGAIGPAAKKAIPNIIDAMELEDFYAPAREALVKIGSDSISPLMRALSSRDAKIRLGAVMALGEFKAEAKKALPLLRQLAATDKDPKIKIQALSAISKINKK